MLFELFEIFGLSASIVVELGEGVERITCCPSVSVTAGDVIIPDQGCRSDQIESTSEKLFIFVAKVTCRVF